ncbi:atrial natriuretic peptide receptor 3-like [Lytechinus pictus]|uniref:atrial natriuretic peptide receptor 3-like n=1 Tax=Lytechinus pictus TaxID=7653 RepID=UPI00240CE6D3|nr:atrial natriuretic peptide receptor 3-like [Lytechinus pictus]
MRLLQGLNKPGFSMANIRCFVHFCITFVSVFDVSYCTIPAEKTMTWGVMLPNYYLATKAHNDKPWLPPGRHYPYHLQMMIPALRIALEKIEAADYLHGWNVTLQVEDSHCFSGTTQFLAADMKVESKVYAYIGPVCESALLPVHRFAQRWNIPLITVGAQSVNYQHSKIITKFMPPHSHVGRIILEVWNTFEWQRGIFLYHFNDRGMQDPLFMAGASYQYLKNAGLNFTHERFDEFSQVDYVELLERAVIPQTSGKYHIQVMG